MNKFLLPAILFLLSFTALAQSHEYAPLQEHELKYKDWTYKTVEGDKDINLRSAIKGKKLVMVVYFASWCPNWRNQAPFTEKLYEKYRNNGFEVIGVSEYSLLGDVKTNLELNKITFPVVVESDSRAMKDKTPHYEYRKETGDMRNWGSPWNIFLQPSLIKKDGEVLTGKAFVVNGELIEAEAEAFIREKLGLPKEEKKAEPAAQAQNKAPEICAEDPKLSNLKKP
jgi:glutathione peroxidase-family protein